MTAKDTTYGGMSDLEAGQLRKLSSLAHIVIAIRPDGTLHMQAFRLGAFNASYANKQDSVLAEIPALLAELRDELFAGDAPETIVDLDESALLAAALALAPRFSDALGSFIAPERICHE